jgi:polysaccharide deacetylase 2 family uncharacterized protein YibQ
LPARTTRTNLETGNKKLEKRNSKLETRKSNSSSRASNFEFRISSFEFRVSFVEFLLPLLLFLLLATPACNWFHPQPVTQSDRRALAGRFKNVVADAGGAQVWIKHPAKGSRRQNPDTSLQVLATPAAYPVVLSRVQQESDKENLEVATSAVNGGGVLRVVTLNVTEHGQRIIQIHLREVPRLLRAAIVIDDMGNDLEAAHKLLALNYPLTFSVLPYLHYSQMIAQEAHRSGHEVMLHLPMEPERNTHASPGEGAILVGMNAAEVQRIVENDLDSVPYVAGVNNHMGSRATQDTALMADVMKILGDHRLYFIDSRTTAKSTALDEARRQRLPAFYRAVFLDDTETVPYTLGQLQEFRQRVEQEGMALAIGHPHPTTIAALAKFLPELERADIEMVAPSQIVRLPEVARLHPPTSPK